jgi:hypothetical protein
MRKLFVVTAATAASILLPGCGKSQPAGEGAQTLGQLVEASDALKAAVVAADEKGSAPPSLADPAGAQMIGRAYDLKSLTQAPIADLGEITKTCASAVEAEMAYISYGMKRGGGAGQQAIMEQNVVRNQDVVTLASRFGIVCGARTVPVATKFVEGLSASDWTPTRKAGLAQVRAGMVNIIQGAVRTQLDPLTPTNRVAILDEMLKAADVYASALTMADRQSVIGVIDQVEQAGATEPAVKGKLERLRAALSVTGCSGLCRY